MEKTVRQVLRDTQLGAEKTRDAKKERKAERTKASTHSDRRAQREGTGKNEANAGGSGS